jgi:hypothetical protein
MFPHPESDVMCGKSLSHLFSGHTSRLKNILLIMKKLAALTIENVHEFCS